MQVPTTAQPHLKGVRVCSVCAATIALIHPLCLPVLMFVYTILGCYPCATSITCWVKQLSSTLIRTHKHTTFKTFSHKHSTQSRNSHEKHKNSHKRWKPGKNAGWQGRQLVGTQINPPVSRRNRDSPPAVRYTQKSKETNNKHKHTHTRKNACLYVWLFEERERISVTLVKSLAGAWSGNQA
jgi:hypothetical protein